MPSPLATLLARGYFPKELPPPFNTKLFGAFSETAPAVFYLDTSKKGIKKNLISRPAIHNQARTGTLRRKLTIPNPVNQYQVARAVTEGWPELKAACRLSPISLTTPRYLKHGTRAINPLSPFDAIPVARARSRTASRYLLATDLSQFYQSIYTHSIPWALHTKAMAKAKPHDYSLLGNVLDLAVRNGQDKQTIGIPIGPDTSLVIAEAILSSVDAQLTGTITQRGFRYIDDIACGFRTVAEAEETLGRLQQLIGDLQLQLNPRKTRIVELPSDLEAAWVPHLRLFTFRSTNAGVQQTDVLSYFGRAFELAANHREEAILRYSVQRMRSVTILEQNWSLYESLLLQCLSVEPGTAPAVIGELYKYHLRMPIDRQRITESLQQLIEDHAPLHHGSEVVWALWGAISLGCTLDAKVIEKSLLASDPCVSLCALHMRAKGLVAGTADFSSLEALMHDDELIDTQWLLVYEANMKGWLPNKGGKDFVAANKHFGPMKTAGVSFYDDAATLQVTVKPADQDDGDDDFDLDYMYMAGDVSG
jgi:hypothetical protein